MSDLKRYKVVEEDYEGFHFELDGRCLFACGPQHGSYVYLESEIDPLLKAHSRLRERVEAYRTIYLRNGFVTEPETDARDALFAELDAQEKSGG